MLTPLRNRDPDLDHDPKTQLMMMDIATIMMTAIMETMAIITDTTMEMTTVMENLTPTVTLMLHRTHMHQILVMSPPQQSQMLLQQSKLITTLMMLLTNVTRKSVHQPTVQVLISPLVNVALFVHHRKLFSQAMKKDEDPHKVQEPLVDQEHRDDPGQKVAPDHLDLQDHNQTLLLYLDRYHNKVVRKDLHQTLFHTCRHKLDLWDPEALLE